MMVFCQDCLGIWPITTLTETVDGPVCDGCAAKRSLYEEPYTVKDARDDRAWEEGL